MISSTPSPPSMGGEREEGRQKNTVNEKMLSIIKEEMVTSTPSPPSPKEERGEGGRGVAVTLDHTR
jgi:hypothetical protein